jgi:hypothetical protein
MGGEGLFGKVEPVGIYPNVGDKVIPIPDGQVFEVVSEEGEVFYGIQLGFPGDLIEGSLEENGTIIICRITNIEMTEGNFKLGSEIQCPLHPGETMFLFFEENDGAPISISSVQLCNQCRREFREADSQGCGYF